jgi:hypothetical protein
MLIDEESKRNLLEHYVSLWVIFRDGAERVKRFAHYLDRYWIPHAIHNETADVHPLFSVKL